VKAILAGTSKGLFTFRSDGNQRAFVVDGPTFRGEEVYGVAVDEHDPARWFAASVSEHWGPTVRRSDDAGASWTDGALAFPKKTGSAVRRVWQVVADGDVVYAGVEPAALFRSTDGGSTFSLVRGLWNHPHRPQWDPGGGGLCLHTILVDPASSERLLVAISTGGVYRSDDGGKTWQVSNTGIRAVHLPDPDVEFGQCVHKVARDAATPDRLYLQNHWGVYRSDDAGESWTPIGSSLPSDFGFPLVAHPRRADTAYVIPLVSDEYRCTPEGRCRVYRTIDGGRSWHPLANGLPQQNAQLTVLRDGFASDGQSGLCFGTRTGEVYASSDDGEHWVEVARHLPPVLSIRAVA